MLRQFIEVSALLALAAASGYVLSQGGYGIATIGFSVALIIAFPRYTVIETEESNG